MRARRVFLCLALASSVFALFSVASAQAATVTVGQLFAPATNCVGQYTYLQTGVASGTSYVVPAAGVITSWSFQDGATVVTGLKLKVGEAAGGGNYTITGAAVAGAQTASAVNTYATNIPVQAGDLIGITLDSGPCATETGNSSDTDVYDAGDVPPGTTATFTATATVKFPVSVQVVLQPGVGSVSPSEGPTVGGTPVTITGHDFTGATAVSFGGAPAKRFSVNSDSSITAVAPTDPAGTVDVTVTTPGGQSPTSAADRFTYVPPPTVTSVSPARGPRTGGTSVTINGSNFTGATAVSFGGAAAKRFSVDSDSSITAVSPARSPGSVDVTVSRASGQSATSAADKFTFVQVCVVPKLKGKKLKAAKKALRKAHCTLGKVKGPRAGKVKHQSRKARTILPAGTKVNIKL